MSARINDELAPTYEQLKTKAAELVKEAAIVYAAYNATVREPDGDFADFQTIHELQTLCQEYQNKPEHTSLKADRDAQQKRADALAVENAELKASRETLAKNALETCNDVFSAGFRNASLQLGLMESTGNRDLYPNPIKALVDEAIRELTTPATDAALAAIRADAMAEGVEACVRALVTSDDDDFTDAPNICAMVARQLREAK